MPGPFGAATACHGSTRVEVVAGRVADCAKARSVNAVAYTREHVAEVLRKTGRKELADEALRSLPERLDEEELMRLAALHGITRDMLSSELGGSP